MTYMLFLPQSFLSRWVDGAPPFSSDSGATTEIFSLYSVGGGVPFEVYLAFRSLSDGGDVFFTNGKDTRTILSF